MSTTIESMRIERIRLSPPAIRLLCVIGSSLSTPVSGAPAERDLIAQDLAHHITSGHAIGMELTDAGRAEFERRWRYRAG